MQATLTLVGDVKVMAHIMAKLGGSGVIGEVTEAPKRRGRPTKEESAARAAALLGDEEETAEVETSEDEGEEESDEEAEDETEGEEDSEETDEETPRKGATALKSGKGSATFSLEDDIIPAFQKYAKKHSREKAAKILAKYKAPNVHKLSAKHYPEVMKLLTKG